MKQIAVTITLIIATVAALAATLWTGSVQAGGVLVIVGVFGWAWWAWMDVWPMVASVWREIVRQKETW